MSGLGNAQHHVGRGPHPTNLQMNLTLSQFGRLGDKRPVTGYRADTIRVDETPWVTVTFKYRGRDYLEAQDILSTSSRW